jgi:hypothetical protein
MGSRRHINLPGTRVNLPALPAKDIACIDVGAGIGADFFATPASPPLLWLFPFPGPLILLLPGRREMFLEEGDGFAVEAFD